MRFKRFTKPKFLKQIGREQLAKLFGQFAEGLATKGVSMPPHDTEDGAYFEALAEVVQTPDALPENLIEALFTIEEMANEHGQERLERAANQIGLDLDLAEELSHGDIAVKVWLANPGLLIEKHNEVRMSRLAGFEYHGSAAGLDRRSSFALPDSSVLGLLEADLDGWCRLHGRGDQMAQIEVREVEGEFWFLLRHGDTYARKGKVVSPRRREVLHYRPDKDDVAVYSPERDEIRIHAGTKGEREFYRKALGLRLFGDDNHFSERRAYTLDPLRDDGPDALNARGVGNIERIQLVETEIHFGGEFENVEIRKSKDIFAAAKAEGREPFPPRGKLVRAGFDVSFKGVAKPRKVQLRPPNVLKLGRYCDAVAIQEWLTACDFRANATPPRKDV